MTRDPFSTDTADDHIPPTGPTATAADAAATVRSAAPSASLPDGRTGAAAPDGETRHRSGALAVAPCEADGSDSAEAPDPFPDPAGGGDTAGGRDAEGAAGGRRAVPSRAERARQKAAATWSRSVLDTALASGPRGQTVSPALRSALRWPAALTLFVCGAIHLPTDLAALRSGGYAEILSLAVLALCTVCAVWLAVRDTFVVWAASAGLAVGVVALHALAGAGAVGLLDSGLGSAVTWAEAAAVLGAAATVGLACTAMVRSRGRSGGTAGA